MSGVNGHTNFTTDEELGHIHFTTNEEVDAIRTQEVLDKAVTGTLILILKWFKVSRKCMESYLFKVLTGVCRHPEVRIHHATAC